MTTYGTLPGTALYYQGSQLSNTTHSLNSLQWGADEEDTAFLRTFSSYNSSFPPNASCDMTLLESSAKMIKFFGHT